MVLEGDKRERKTWALAEEELERDVKSGSRDDLGGCPGVDDNTG
jgi:hypothetical protein